MYILRVLIIFSCVALLYACDKKAPSELGNVTDTSSKVNAAGAENDDTVWVYIDNGALQCQKPALRLGQTRATLLSAQIEVIDSKCADITGTMVAAMCGLKDLGIHIHNIKRVDAKRARSFGFELTDSLSHYGNKSYNVTECPSSNSSP